MNDHLHPVFASLLKGVGEPMMVVCPSCDVPTDEPLDIENGDQCEDCKRQQYADEKHLIRDDMERGDI